MAISSGASPGVEVETAAKDSRLLESTLGSQSGANADQVIVPNAIGTNNQSDLVGSPSYVGRLIEIRPNSEGLQTSSVLAATGTGYVATEVLTLTGGTFNNAAQLIVDTVDGGGAITSFHVSRIGDYTVTPSNAVATTSSASGTGATVTAVWDGNAETRYILADASNTLTVAEGWVQPPISGEDWWLSYIIQDVATVTGLGLINKRLSDYSSTRRLTVGLGSAPAWLAFVDGVSLETRDNSSTTVADFIVKSEGRFDNGYSVAGKAIGGGYVIGTPAVNGEFVMDCQAGSLVILRDWFLTCVKNNKCIFDGTVFIQGGKFFAATDTLEFIGTSVNLEGIFVQGRGAAGDEIVWTGDVGVVDFIVADVDGFNSETTTGAETFFLFTPVFINTFPKLTVEQDKTWIIVNPSWSIDESDQSDLLFNSGTGNVVWWASEATLTVQDVSLTPIVGARVYIYEGLLTGELALDLTTDANGVAADAWIYKQFDDDGASGLTVLTLGDHAIKVYNHGEIPFVAPIDSIAPWLTDIALPADAHISETDRSTAETNGPSVVPTQDTTNANTLLSFDTGVNTLAVGETVTGNGGATGVVQEISEGDSVSGKVFLKSRNATAFVQGETLSSSGTWTGEVENVAAFQQAFTWHIDGDSKSMQAIYDWQSAKLADPTLEAIWKLFVEWGESTEGYVLNWDGSGYFTNRSGGQGVFVTKRGAGDITFFTADDGTTWTPPASSNMKVTITNQEGDAKENIRVRYQESDGTLISQGNTDSGGVFTFVIEQSRLPLSNVRIDARRKDFVFKDQTVISVPTSGFDIPISLEPEEVGDSLKVP